MRISTKLPALLFLPAVLLAALVFGTASASGETPAAWWHLTSRTRPTYLQPGQAKDTVQDVTVSGSPGEGVTLLYVVPRTEGEEVRVAEFPVGAEASVVQASLEGALGSGDVEVVGGVGAMVGVEPYVVTFTGALTDQSVAPLSTEYSAVPVSVAVVVVGRPAGYIVVTAANVGNSYADPCVGVGSGGKFKDSGCTEAGEPGAEAFEEEPVTLTDKLPPGLEAVGIEGDVDDGLETYGHPYELECVLGSVSCSFTGTAPSIELPSLAYGYPRSVAPYQQLQMRIAVRLKEAGAQAAKSGEENVAGIVGGGAPAATAKQKLVVSEGPVPFGAALYEMSPEESGGGVDTQAGSHPFQLTTTLSLNETLEGKPAGLVKDLHFKLPPGLIGNPTPFAQCPLVDFLAEPAPTCSAQTVVGVSRADVRVDILGAFSRPFPFVGPVYNLEPAVGEPARFGFVFEEVPVLLTTAVRTGGDYGVTVSVVNVDQAAEFLGSEVTLWGVPGDARHNRSRGRKCIGGALEFSKAGKEYPGDCPVFAEESHPPSLLSLPTACTGPLQTSVEADSWLEPDARQSLSSTQALPAMDGCDRLPFSSSISVTPDGQQASTPTGLTVGIHIPQDATLNGGGLSEAAVKDTTVTLPEGVQISPAASDGLLACSDEQAGFTGVEAGTNLFTPGPVGCPDASKVGTAEIKTPLLPEPLEGAVYLAAQDANPFGSLIALYIYAEAPVAGVKVKLAGEIKLNESTGQIVTVFPNNPQVPFEEARLHFFGGSRAPLSTPPSCGSYSSTASIAPWSGNERSKSSSTFEITSGPNGASCQSPRPFQPGFNAGTTSVQAGGYTPLTMTLSRPDADQPLGKLSVVFPPGVSSALRGVKLCEEPQAATGQCPAESQIGTVTVSAGLGGDPYPVETGKAYITGPYEGDPFGVDVVVPAVAGPFNLGTEVVRSKVDVDPTDAHLTVVSDAFPTMLDGIPLQLQHINVLVNRPGFVFNPTSCEPMKLTGVLGSSEGATADVSTPFQVTNCAALSFKPEFAVSTSAKTSRVEGASLHVSLTLPAGAQGTKANVSKVKVSLPKQLPSPLKTLQKACTEKVFAENPSSCPVASRVGEAKVETPVLEGPLTGPAYFVSHGGAKYPELIIVLTGEDGVTVQVHGETFISKAGITTATFGTVPDVPFSNFELELPEREYPALTANGNLCKGTLVMPTEFLGQNGLKINQETKISVTGCPKSKKASHKRKHASKRKHTQRAKGR